MMSRKSARRHFAEYGARFGLPMPLSSPQAVCRSILQSFLPQATHNLAFLLACLIGATIVTPARAQQKDAALSVMTLVDDNLRRTPDSVKSLQPHGGDDIITFANASAGLETNFGALETTLAGSLGRRFYAYNSDLNSTEYRLGGKAVYQLLNTTIHAEGLYARQSSSFTDVLSRGTNVQNLSVVTVDGARRLVGDIEATVNLGYRTNSNSNNNISRGDNHGYTYGVGLKYTSPAKNSIELGYSKSISNGSGTRTILIGKLNIPYSANAHDDNVFAEVDWSPSAIWKVQGTIGYTWHDDRSILNADFKGLVQNASIRYSPSAPTSLILQASRAFTSNDQIFSNGVVTTSYIAIAQARLFGSVAVNANAQRTNRTYRYDLQENDPTTANRRDQYLIYGVGASYKTGTLIDIALSYSRIEISTGPSGSKTTDNAIILTITRSGLF